MSEQRTIEGTPRHFGEYVSQRSDIGDIALREFAVPLNDRHVQYADAFHVRPDGTPDAQPLTDYEVETIHAMHKSWQAARQDER